MKTKKVAAMLPLLAGIGLGIAALAGPFLVANHYVMSEGKRFVADNIIFFFWGKYYTVAGANLIQSQMVTYDFGDFPVYTMIVIIIGLILGAISMFGGRGVILNIKGREVKIKLDTNPVWLQMFATILITLSYIYINDASNVLIDALRRSNYAAEHGPSIDFLLGSVVALAISTVMTAVKFLKERNKEDSKT